MLGIEKEFSIFLSACLLGNTICMIYCAVRVFRRIVKHSLFWISLEDFVFWVWTGIYLFMEIYRTCNGSIRWYFVVGVLAGGILTWWIFLKFMRKVLKKDIDKTKKTR